MASESEANFRICSSASEALSYMPCALQYTKPSNHNGLWVFWGQPNNEFPTVFPSASGTTMYADTVKEKITCALKNAYISDYYKCWLVQFWAPVTTNDRIFLTTCDLPFGLTKLHEGLCLYRSECLKLRIPVGTDNSVGEYQLGPVGRVFKHGFPETSPDVSLYSSDDYPQHGLALNAGQGNYLSIPVFGPGSNQCTGVLEIIGDKKGSFYQELVQMVYEILKKVDLRSSNMYDRPDEKGFKGLGCALKELEEQLNFICRTHQLPLAQTWLPIVVGRNIEGFMTTKEQFCICTSAGYEFRAACDMFHLGKSQGVVGQAFLSRNSCYCSDITQLRMSEYPLAHVAHRVGLHGSFAICLQSSYTGDYVYILEFFLPHDNKSDCRSPQTLLNMLLVTMKRQFRSFELASEKKLGEQLSVEVLPVPSGDGLKTFEICQNSKHSSDVEAIASRKEIPWLDTLNSSLNGGNAVNTCPENIDATTSTATTANRITEVRNVSIQANRVVCTCSEEKNMRNKSEGQYRVDSVVLQQAVGSKDNSSVITVARLGIQSLPNNCGREHQELNDMNCSSDQLDSANAADGLRKETSGIDRSCHDTTESLARATTPRIQVNSESAPLGKRSKVLPSELVTGDSENSAKVPKLCDFTSKRKTTHGSSQWRQLPQSSRDNAFMHISISGHLQSGAAMFDMEYSRWLDDDQRHIAELRTALQAHLGDADLRVIVDGYIAHYDEIFQLKGVAAKSDIFHLITGMWTTLAERCLLWMGGFRPSELIKDIEQMLIAQLDPLTEQQVVGVYSLRQSSQQAEEALSQGLEQLQQSIIETDASGSRNDGMHPMAGSLGKFANLEGFVRQADKLRQQTLHQLHIILTVRQAARCFLVIGEYYGRLRALSSLWASRPRETMMVDDNSCQTTTELQMIQQASQHHFSTL